MSPRWYLLINPRIKEERNLVLPLFQIACPTAKGRAIFRSEIQSTSVQNILNLFTPN